MLTGPLLALALVLSPPTAFDDVVASPSVSLLDHGGGDGAGGSVLPAIGSVVLGTIAGGVIGFGALANASVGFPGLSIIVAVALDVLVQGAIPWIFGIQRNFLTSGVGVLGGIVLGLAGGFAGAAIGRATSPGGGGFADLGMAILGMVVGFSLGPPILTVLDPFGFSREPVPVSQRVLDARPVERS